MISIAFFLIMSQLPHPGLAEADSHVVLLDKSGSECENSSQGLYRVTSLI